MAKFVFWKGIAKGSKLTVTVTGEGLFNATATVTGPAGTQPDIPDPDLRAGAAVGLTKPGGWLVAVWCSFLQPTAGDVTVTGVVPGRPAGVKTVRGSSAGPVKKDAVIFHVTVV